MLAGIFRNPSGSNGQVNGLIKVNGGVFNTRIYATQGDTNRFNFDGVFRQVQVGNSSTPVTRQDFKIDSPFPDSPESSRQNCIEGIYNSGLGKINQATLISTTGGAGSITEVCKFFRCRNLIGQVGEVVCIFRDIVSPVGFIAGESINIDHEVLI